MYVGQGHASHRSTIRFYRRWRLDGRLRTAGQTQLSPLSYHTTLQQSSAPEAPTPRDTVRSKQPSAQPKDASGLYTLGQNRPVQKQAPL